MLDHDGARKYKCVANFALSVHSLPQSNADCERCSSDINRTSKHRNRLNTDIVRDVVLAKQSVK